MSKDRSFGRPRNLAYNTTFDVDVVRLVAALADGRGLSKLAFTPDELPLWGPRAFAAARSCLA